MMSTISLLFIYVHMLQYVNRVYSTSRTHTVLHDGNNPVDGIMFGIIVLC